MKHVHAQGEAHHPKRIWPDRWLPACGFVCILCAVAMRRDVIALCPLSR